MVENKTILPSIEKLLELEKSARIEGSGINYESLLGQWKFKSVWKQGSMKEDSISSTLLQVFSATLELKKDIQIPEIEQYTIANSIQFGLISVKFSGLANLERKQPLLPFSLNWIQIKLGSLMVLERALPATEQKKRPFFALIATGSNGRWLSARGKGGGLALWERNEKISDK